MPRVLQQHWSMEFPLLVEDPAGTFPLSTASDDLNVEANGDNLVLFVGCPQNWLDTGGVVYNVELCGTFNCTLNWLDTVGGVVYMFRGVGSNSEVVQPDYEDV